MAQHILIVDDDPTQRRLLETVITRQGYQSVQAAGGREALDILNGPKGTQISAVLLDMVMPEMDGAAVLEQLKPVRPNLPVIVLTAQGGVDTVVNAMRAGADDFMVKPASPERIQVSLQNALKLNVLTTEITRLTRRQKDCMGFDDVIAKSTATQHVIRLAQRAATSNIPILITGESGVGKEVIARAIQGESERSGKPFVTVNCGAIPDNLVESILFGHEKGAFTGAVDRHVGKFQEANGGTLFLDEIGELRPDLQVKLLRALQEGEIDPVGAKKPTKIDIRLISATNKDLLDLVRAGDFREDLYYRLNVFPIEIPPLRERADDIPDLIRLFLKRFTREEGKQILDVDRQTISMLCAYHWPGNVRQLENAVFRAVVLCDGELLTMDDFPQISQFMGIGSISGAMSRDRLASDTPDFETAENDTKVDDFGTEQSQSEGQPSDPESLRMPAASSAQVRPVTAPQDRPANTAGQPGSFDPSTVDYIRSGGLTRGDDDDSPDHIKIKIIDESGHFRSLEDIEGEMIRLAIDRYAGHMSEVARRLGIGRSTLYRKVRELGLEVRSASE